MRGSEPCGPQQRNRNIANLCLAGAFVQPVQPRIHLKPYLWLNLSGPDSTGTFKHATRLEFNLGVDGVSVSLILLTTILAVAIDRDLI